MNSLGQQLCKAILDVLADPQGVDGGLMAEVLLNGAVRQRVHPTPTLTEFEDALKFCESKKWIDAQRGKLGGLRWVITDTGAVARRDL